MKENTSRRKTSLATRILLLILSFLMIVTLAVTTVYMIADIFTEDEGTENSTGSDFNESDDATHDHTHSGGSNT